MLVALLQGCGTATPYQPLAEGYGFGQQQLETNRYRVYFSGNSLTPRETVENYLLYRAAELTLNNGKDYFVIADQGTEVNTVYRSHFDTFGGYGAYRWHPSSFGALGLGTGTSMPVTRYEAVANILIFSGQKPQTDPKAFDAREIKTRLEPTVVRPSEKA